MQQHCNHASIPMKNFMQPMKGINHNTDLKLIHWNLEMCGTAQTLVMYTWTMQWWAMIAMKSGKLERLQFYQYTSSDMVQHCTSTARPGHGETFLRHTSGYIIVSWTKLRIVCSSWITQSNAMMYTTNLLLPSNDLKGQVMHYSATFQFGKSLRQTHSFWCPDIYDYV